LSFFSLSLIALTARLALTASQAAKVSERSKKSALISSVIFALVELSD